MPAPDYLALLRDSRAKIAELKKSVTLLTTQWTLLEKEATKARRGLSSSSLEDALAAAAEAKAAVLDARTQLELERQNADNYLIALYGANELKDVLPGNTALPGVELKYPLVLMPLRIETRFKGQELWIRIYPDTIHVNSHEPELTDDEVISGQQFWKSYYETATTDSQALAWQQLVDRYGEPRAAWIAKTLTPTLAGTTITFPTVDIRSASWTRAPVVRAFPDKWVALGFGAGLKLLFYHESGAVLDELAVGPDPGATYTAPLDGSMTIDPRMKWMVDFDEAVRVGMAVRVLLPADATAGLTLLLVVGVKYSLSPGDSQLALTELFDVHHYASGLSFVQPGTPTNITEESEDPEEEPAEEAMRREVGAVGTLTDQSNASLLARALGIDSNILERVKRGTASDQQEAADMNQALWPATMGYYLGNLMTDDYGIDLDWARGHFIDNVRGRGSFTTIRVNDQPYGILPIAYDGSFRFKTGGTAQDEDVPITEGDALSRTRGLMQKMRTQWLKSIENVPHLSRDSEDTATDLAKIFAMNPQPYRFAVRAAVPSEYFPSLDPDDIDNTDATNLLESWGIAEIPGSPALLNVLYTPGSLEWDGPLVQSEELSWNETLVHDYISRLQKATPDELDDEPWADPPASIPTDSLLYILLRQSAIRVAADSADVQKDFSEALTRLAGLSSAALEQLLLETLAVCSSRLDAWDVSLMNANFAAARAVTSNGIIIGAYGWVEDLRPGTQKQSSLGYVHAPSSTHAATAAVLRSVWAAQGDMETSMAVNLTSDRIRTAKWVLEGIRAGQSMNYLLGYQFERALHDYSVNGTVLDKYIDEFRDQYPLVVGQIAEHDDDDAESSMMAAGDLVDGLALVKAWQAEPVEIRFGSNGLPAEGSTDYGYLSSILDDLEATLDAAADALTAESVHQLVQGNIARTSATLDAACSGDAPVPELLFPNTPYSGSSITHRLLLLFPQTGVGGAQWPGSPESFRSRLEPVLELWVASQLGDPSVVQLSVKYLPPKGEGETPLASTKFTLFSVLSVFTPRMSALDFLAVLPADNTQRQSELDQRIRWYAMRTRDVNVVPETARVVISYERSEEMTQGSLALAELMELGRALKKVITSSRAATAFDLALPTDSVEAVVDLHELELRASGVAGDGTASSTGELGAHATDLSTVLGDEGTVGDDPESVRNALVLLSNMGVPGAFPRQPVGDTEEVRAAVYAQGWTVASRVAKTQQTLASLIAGFPKTASTAASVTHYIEVIQSVVGKSFPIFPRFNAWNSGELSTTFSTSTSLQGGDPTAVFGWLSSVARVRPGAARLERFVLLKESLQDELRAANPFGLSVGQLPSGDATWAGMKVSEVDLGVGGRVSLVAHLPAGTTGLDGSLHGLVIDEWSEKLPRSGETSSVAFHFNAPGARPPNAVLLCSSWHWQDQEKMWTMADVYGAVIETFLKAKYRMVDTSTAQEVGHFFPAIFVPTDASDGVVESELMRGVIQKPS